MPYEDIVRGDGAMVIQRIEALCTVSKDGYAARAGERLVLREWQKQLILRLFARRPDGRRRHREALIGEPRKNGKSAIGSGLALDGLFFDGKGAEVYSAGAEKEQARIVYGETKRMIEAEPELKELCDPMRDVIYVPSTNSTYRVLSAEAYSKEGLNISRALIDELHAHPTPDLYNVLTLASGARRDPMVISITTAGVMSDRNGQDTICYEKYKHGIDIIEGRVEDPYFFMAWWGAPDGADHTDPAVWEAANPGYGDLIDPDDFRARLLGTPEAEFRTKRLNQWVAAEQVWLPAGTWDACAVPEWKIPDGERVIIGFDGAFSGDSTAAVVATMGEQPHVDVVGLWEKGEHDAADWRAPRLDIMETLRQACKRWRVVEICVDPYIWQSDLEALEEEGLPVVEFPQHGSRMIPATQRFYELVLNKNLSHSGNRDLARHIGNAVLKTDARGSRLTKEAKDSKRRIDLAVASVMAVQRSGELGANEYATVVFPADQQPDKPEDSPEWRGPKPPKVLTQEETTTLRVDKSKLGKK